MYNLISQPDVGKILISAGVEWDSFTGSYSRASLIKFLALSYKRISIGLEAIENSIDGLEKHGVHNLHSEAYTVYSFLLSTRQIIKFSQTNRSGVKDLIDAIAAQKDAGPHMEYSLDKCHMISDRDAADQILSVHNILEEVVYTLEKVRVLTVELYEPCVAITVDWITSLGAIYEWLSRQMDPKYSSVVNASRAVH